MECPSGTLYLGKDVEAVDASVPVTGRYEVEVLCQGREAAREKADELWEATSDLDALAAIEIQDREGSGIEKYLLRMWRSSHQRGELVPGGT